MYFVALFLAQSVAIPLFISDDGSTFSNQQSQADRSFSSILTSDRQLKASNISSSCLLNTTSSPSSYPIHRIKTWSLHGILPLAHPEGVMNFVQVDHLKLTPGHHYTLNYAVHPRNWFTGISFMDNEDSCGRWLFQTRLWLQGGHPPDLRGGFAFKLPDGLRQPARICLVDGNEYWYQAGDRGSMTLWDVSPR